MTEIERAPFFSVCIPTYNSSQFIAYAIESVLEQTCGDFELLIQDDMSSDNTADIIKQFADPRIRYSRNDENLGIFGNLNVLCEKARGKYIKVLCADDMLARHCLQTIQNVVRNHEDEPRLIAIKECNRAACLEGLEMVSELHMFTIDKNNLFRFLCERNNWGGGLAELCVEREFFRQHGFFGPYDKDADFSKDIINWFDMVLKTGALMINRPLVYQRPHNSQARHKLPRLNQLHELFDFFYGRERELFHLTNFYSGRKRYLERYIISHYWYGIKSLLRGQGTTYLREVSRLRKEHDSDHLSLNDALFLILERFIPIRI